MDVLDRQTKQGLAVDFIKQNGIALINGQIDFAAVRFSGGNFLSRDPYICKILFKYCACLMEQL